MTLQPIFFGFACFCLRESEWRVGSCTDLCRRARSGRRHSPARNLCFCTCAPASNLPNALPTPSPRSSLLPARPRLAPHCQKRSSLEQLCSSRDHPIQRRSRGRLIPHSTCVKRLRAGCTPSCRLHYFSLKYIDRSEFRLGALRPCFAKQQTISNCL